MKKTLIATAIAGAMSFSVAAQAAPVVYGNIQVAVDLENDLTAGDNGSTFGVKGENAMEGGLTSFYKIEADVNAAAAKSADSSATGDDANAFMVGDQAYMGVKGDFGQVLVGSKDTLINDFVQDVVYTPEALKGAHTGVKGGSEVAQLQYTGDFDGVKVGASVQLDGDEQAMQFVAALPVGAMTVSAGFDSVEGDIAAAVSLPVDALTVGAKLEMTEADDMIIAASASMDYSNGNVYGIVSMSDAKDQTNVAFGATYSVASNMYVYGEFGSGDADLKENLAGTYVGAALVF